MATTTDARIRFQLESQPREISRINRERRFYALAAFAMLLITAVGFREFLFHGRAVGGVPMTPQIVVLVVAHGLAMLSWVVLFCVQSALIVVDRRRPHIKLGRIEESAVSWPA